MKLEIATAFFSALSLGLCLFLGVLCWLRRRENPSLRWLAILLGVLALRLSKSVLTVAFPEAAFPAAVVGLAGAALIGPLAMRYVHALRPLAPQPGEMALLHFIPAFLLAAGWVAWLEEVPANWFFGAANLLTFTYLGVAAAWAANHRADLRAQAVWLKGFFVGLGLLCAVFLVLMYCQNEGRTYLLVTALAALVLYGISFWAIRHLELPMPFVKKLPTDDAATVLRELGSRVEQLFETEKTHTDTTLTVQKLAQHLRAPPHQLSKAVNFHFGKSFPELLAQYRVRHAEGLLQSPAAERFSIEAIAYDSGFASLSAFYVAFKKRHGTTPADFKRKGKTVGQQEGITGFLP